MNRKNCPFCYGGKCLKLYITSKNLLVNLLFLEKILTNQSFKEKRRNN